jgi:hypothetical protein
MTLGGILVLALAAAFIAPAQAHPTEIHAMSDDNSQASISADVARTLAHYDATRDPALLRDAGDQIVREDGSIPPDPAEATRAGHERLALWIDLFTRFKRDLDPSFDPDKPPHTRVSPPPIDGEQLMPGIDPAQIPDPVLRKQYEDEIARNAVRVEQFSVQSDLHEVHNAALERAAASLKDARDQLGLRAADIKIALDQADIIPADRAALEAGVAQ